MSTEGMAVTTLDTPTDQEIERIKSVGAKAVAHRREMTKLDKQIAGMSWGQGLEPMTRAVFAEFCQVTRANPATHIDVLGGKLYLNAEYWTDKLRTDPYFVDYDQVDLSPSVEEALREQSRRMQERAETFPADSPEHAKWRSRAYELEDEAEAVAVRRSRWSPRASATAVIETVIRRFINAAPIDKIRSGEIAGDALEPYIVEVAECNWAGGMGDSMAKSKKFDPIGDANPGTTARTRSLRRCANKAFSAWMQQYETQIAKAEEYLEAEYEVIATSVHDGSQPQRLQIGDASTSGEIVQDATTPAELPTDEGEEDQFDRKDAHKRFFATLKDAGIGEKDRKKWQREHELPESSKDFTQADYDRAQEILVGPVKQSVMERAGKGLEDLSLRVLQKSLPEYLRDWKALSAALDAQGVGADDDAEEEHAQAPLEL